MESKLNIRLVTETNFICLYINKYYYVEFINKKELWHLYKYKFTFPSKCVWDTIGFNTNSITIIYD